MKRSLGPKALIFPTPVLIIGTYSADGQPNAMSVAYGGICCFTPPFVAVSIRPACLTHANILREKAFTVNLPSVGQVLPADYVGVVSGRTADKFAQTGLTPVAGTKVHAPLIQEFPLGMECRLINTYTIGSHTQFVGEIVESVADEAVLDADAKVIWDKVQPMSYAVSSRNYHGLGAVVGKGFTTKAEDLKRTK